MMFSSICLLSTMFIIKNALGFLIQNATVVQNRDNFITKCHSYYKMLLYLYLFFYLLSQQSDALNSLIPNVLESCQAFSLSMIPSIGTFCFFFQITTGKLLTQLIVAPTACAFSWRRHSRLFQRCCQFVLIFHPCRKSVFRNTIYCCHVLICRYLFQVF